MNAFLVRYRPDFSDDVLERVVIREGATITQTCFDEINSSLPESRGSEIVGGFSIIEIRYIGEAIITQRSAAIVVFNESRRQSRGKPSS